MLQIVMFVMALAAGAADLTAVQDDLLPLEGRWEGDQVIMQVGACSIDGAGRKKSRVIVVLTRDPNGSFRVQQTDAAPPPQTLPPPDDDALSEWHAKIGRDGKLTIDAEGRATCGVEERTYRVRYEGRIKQRGNGWELQLRGTETVCPRARCEFFRHYKLRR